MKSLVTIIGAVVLSLAVANVVEARGGGHGGHGHGGRGGHGRGFHRGGYGRGFHRGHDWGYGRGYARGYGRWGYGYRGGLYRRYWANRVWSNLYGCYVYSDPAVVGTYYWSAPDAVYYPISRLPVLKSKTTTE
jgi:hypothetical protein